MKNAECWSVNGDDMTGALYILKLWLSARTTSIIPAPIKTRMVAFWYQLTRYP